MQDKIEQILEERGDRYGPFENHAGVTQELKVVIRRRIEDNPQFKALNPESQMVVMEALDMVAHKIGRIVNGDPLYDDSWDDIAGYAKLVSKHSAEYVPF